MKIGSIESSINEYPIHDILDNNEFINNLHDDELKIYFILDRYVFTNVNAKTNEKKIEFDSDYYNKKYDLKFSGTFDEFYRFYREFTLRKLSLHTLILGKLLPFTIIGITKKDKISMRHSKISYFNDFRFFEIKKEWNYLKNDLEKLEQNIKQKSSLQKALVWFTLAKLSTTRIDEFMNLYRSLEEFSREFHQKLDAKVNKCVIKEIPRCSKEIGGKFARKSKFENIESFLMLHNIEPIQIKSIITFRNKRIAHGQDYKVEFDDELRNLIDEMQEITHDIINNRIKEMKIEGLMSTKFLYNYDLLINKSKHKMVLSDHYELKYLRELCNEDDSISSYGLGQIPEKDISSSNMLKHIETDDGITINEEMCTKLIKNFGKFIDY